MHRGISEIKMAVRPDIAEQGQQMFDDTGIKKWKERNKKRKKVGNEVGRRSWLAGRSLLSMRQILTPDVAYSILCRQELTYSVSDSHWPHSLSGGFSK